MEREQQRLADEVLRLHVVAASDDKRDQDAKLKVRDALLDQTSILLSDVNNAEEAKLVLSGKLDLLDKVAEQTLRAYGMDSDVSVSLKRELFGTRKYGGFSLPGGYYDALRIVIGPGEGKNWWCVVYPQICTAASMEELGTVAAMGGMDRDQVLLITGEQPKYVLKFRSMELMENLLSWFRSGEEGIPVSR